MFILVFWILHPQMLPVYCLKDYHYIAQSTSLSFKLSNGYSHCLARQIWSWPQSHHKKAVCLSMGSPTTTKEWNVPSTSAVDCQAEGNGEAADSGLNQVIRLQRQKLSVLPTHPFLPGKAKVNHWRQLCISMGLGRIWEESTLTSLTN